ncbi:MAG: rhomboid family intramembrane serine protease [Thermoplasmata archaeon]|nr:MAG: rhomboid family intramembrane serine protease [Thermoplasmata archaeon]
MELGMIVSIAIIILIIIGLAYALIKNAVMTMTLAIVNFIIFFIWRFSVEGTMGDLTFYSQNETYRFVLDNLSIRYGYFSDQPQMLYTLFTHMYLHFDIMHIISNMIFLVLFGVPFEERVGPKALAAIYFTSGIAASAIDAGFSLYNYSNPFGQLLGTNPDVYHIGASGAIFGIMGAFVALYPKDKVFVPIGIIVMNVPVYIGALAYAAIESILAFANPNDGIGHMVHIMGFLSGMMIAIIFSKYIKSEERVLREGEVDLQVLKKLATTNELRDIFLKIEDEDEPDIRKAWLEKYAESAKCPKCKSNMKLKGHKIKCSCGYSLKF